MKRFGNDAGMDNIIHRNGHADAVAFAHAEAARKNDLFTELVRLDGTLKHLDDGLSPFEMT